MSVATFHWVQQQMEKYSDMLHAEKKKGAVWARRLHLALRAYGELLHSLRAMGASADAAVQEAAQVLQTNLFYVLEYREFVLAAFLAYDETKMPRWVCRVLGSPRCRAPLTRAVCRQVVPAGFGGDGASVPEDAGALLQENGLGRPEKSQEEGEK